LVPSSTAVNKGRDYLTTNAAPKSAMDGGWAAEASTTECRTPRTELGFIEGRFNPDLRKSKAGGSRTWLKPQRGTLRLAKHTRGTTH